MRDSLQPKPDLCHLAPTKKGLRRALRCCRSPSGSADVDRERLRDRWHSLVIMIREFGGQQKRKPRLRSQGQVGVRRDRSSQRGGIGRKGCDGSLRQNMIGDHPPLPAAVVRRRIERFFCRQRPRRAEARLCLFRGRAGAEIGGGSTGRLRIGSLVSVCVVWRAAPLVESGVCRAARKLPPTKKPITPANDIQISRWGVDPSATNQMRMPPALS